MNKATIEVTTEGVKVTAEIEGQTFTRQMKLEEDGSWSGVGAGSFRKDMPEEDEDLAEHLDDLMYEATTLAEYMTD